jgi:hypothetical protein
MTRPDGIVEAGTRTVSAGNCFAKIRIRATFAQSRDRTRALGTPGGESEFSYFFTSQPVEKSRIGRIKPRVSKQFCLDRLGSIGPRGRRARQRLEPRGHQTNNAFAISRGKMLDCIGRSSFASCRVYRLFRAHAWHQPTRRENARCSASRVWPLGVKQSR